MSKHNIMNIEICRLHNAKVPNIEICHQHNAKVINIEICHLHRAISLNLPLEVEFSQEEQVEQLFVEVLLEVVFVVELDLQLVNVEGDMQIHY